MSTPASDRVRLRLGLAELLDLELELLADRERPVEELHARDDAIAARLAAEGPPPRDRDRRSLLLAWLAEVRGRAASAGQRLAALRAMTAAGLFAFGVFSGAGAVAGWLLGGDGLPVNVVNFWPVMVGTQLALLLLWAVAALPAALPGLGGARELLRALSAALPSLLGWVLTRLPGLRRQRLLERIGELRRLDHLYASLRFWILTGLTQGFALGFNLGAVGALVGIPYMDDPAFGWRSRLLDEPTLVRVSRTIATPWAGLWPDAVPDAEQVAVTRYSSVDPRFARGRPAEGGPVPWDAWWAFLVASLLTYGVLPRLLLFAGTQLAVTRTLAGLPLDHVDCERLVARLQRERVDTRASEPEVDGPGSSGDAEQGDLRLAEDGDVAWLGWAGLAGAPEQVSAEVASRLGARRARAVGEVGVLDAERDREVLAALAGDDAAAVALVVGAWEPPVGDHLDLLRTLRDAIGRRPLRVLIVDRDPEGRLLAAPARALAQWRAQLAGLGDPWLRVGSLLGAET